MRVYRSMLISVSETCLLGTRHPALRRQDPGQGRGMERENLIMDIKGDGEGGEPASQEGSVAVLGECRHYCTLGDPIQPFT